MKKEELEKAVRDFFGDTSRDLRETLDGLRDIQFLCDELSEAILEDLREKEE